jgi:hypothetical protein
VGNEVNRVPRKYLNNRRWDEDAERSVPLLTELTEGQFAKLKFLARRFGDAESTVASRLLNAAMEDSLRIVGAHDAITPEMYDTVPLDEQNSIIDSQVSGYRQEIQRILLEEDSS